MEDTSNIIHNLHQAVRYLTKESNSRLQEHGIYSSQWSVLYCLDRFGPMSQTEIWRYLNVEAPTVTRTIARLEESGWINREPGADKREKIVSLTPLADEKLEQIKQSIKAFEEEMLRDLNENDRRTLTSLLGKIGSWN
ncbi:MarR family transcriptional regulator [Bacillus sp. FJAT-42376]|uniref:MarR family winged helix-turn-helix transcriptional regulator n=1 Tax=Bacillus sp. FJAT-42376 TaxID=2014076 RepID=UPI000F4F2CA5|nr:MarR family transcriptional regulator [Bacillus sp. FJAT-42376]AZB41630.1 MarR family transcriptional regulator [Bacillus sp. FJAT-42376]